jgi:hypothetical protein
MAVASMSWITNEIDGGVKGADAEGLDIDARSLRIVCRAG